MMPRMQSTPAFPAELRRSPSPAYASIYDYDPSETRLFGTESLYGDWDSTVLLLAKDFAPDSYIQERQAKAPGTRLFSHDPTFQTNKNLVKRFRPLLPCEPLYGSALAGLLKKNGQRSGSLPDRALIEPFAIEVIRFTVSKMPNLRAIACLGADSWEFATCALTGERNTAWSDHRRHRRCVEAEGLTLHALLHPSRCTGGLSECVADWLAMKSLAGTF